MEEGIKIRDELTEVVEVTEVAHVEEETTTKELKAKAEEAFLYICDACSNYAIKATSKMVGIKLVCQVCHKELITREENWIEA